MQGTSSIIFIDIQAGQFRALLPLTILDSRHLLKGMKLSTRAHIAGVLTASIEEIPSVPGASLFPGVRRARLSRHFETKYSSVIPHDTKREMLLIMEWHLEIPRSRIEKCAAISNVSVGRMADLTQFSVSRLLLTYSIATNTD